MKDAFPDEEALLKKALARLREIGAPESEDLEAWAQSVQDMRIYQEELKIQAEELERRQLELEGLRKLYFQCFDLAPIPIMRVNEAGEIRQCNLKATEAFQIERDKLNSLNSRALLRAVEGESFARLKNCLQRVIDDRMSVSCSIDLMLDGHAEYFRIEAIPTASWEKTSRSEEQQVILFFVELTEARNRELELRKMEAALEENPAVIFMTGVDGTFQYVNRRFEEVYGYSWEELKGQKPSILKSGNHTDKFYRQMWSSLQRGDVWKAEMINRRRDGSRVSVRTTVFPVYQHRGQPVYYIAIQEDISQEKKTLEKLGLYSGFAEAVNFGVVFTDRDRNVTWTNSAFERTTGYSLAEVEGKNLKNVLQGPDTDPVIVEKMHEAMEAGRAFECELLNYHKSGTSYWIQLQIEPIYDEKGNVTHFVSIQTDVTERRAFDRQLRQRQRMESIGSLAGGMAHDINNLLQPISLGIQQLKTAHPDLGQTHADVLEMMRESVDKAAQTIRQILTFARGGDEDKVAIDILPLVKQAIRLAGETVPRQIDIQTELDEGPVFVRIGPTQITQVIMNLILNARDAISDKGQIRVRVHRDDDHVFDSATLVGTLPETRAVWIDVEDDGCGIPSADIPAIFEPFFTTKSLDQGTGMGLATTYGIVNKSGGSIQVRSKRNSGSSFRIGLPLAEPPQTSTSPSLPPGEHDQERSKANNRLVIVDDEKAIGKSLKTIFSSRGYQAFVFDQPRQALEWLTLGQEKPDLLLVDYMMPEMDGLELVAEVRKHYPKLPVILMTGVQDAEAEKRFEEASINTVLSKPFDVNHLLAQISNLLRNEEDRDR